MGNNLFSLKSVPGATRTELTARSTVKGVTWAAQRFPWVNIESMSDACGGEYASMSSKLDTNVNKSYEPGLVRPKPVITSVQVKKQGELGTTRSCTVELKAFTDAQLIALQKCYFIPGMTVRVQWGWSVSVNGAAPPQLVTGGLPDSKAICQIQTKAGGSAIYDGLQGLVTNFNYKLNSENIWDCSFELVAASEATGESKVAVHNDKCSGCERTYKSEDENGESKDVVEKKSLLGTFFYDVDADASDGETGFGDFKSKLSSLMDVPPVIAGGNYEGEDRDGTGGSAQSAWSLGNYDTTEGYISYYTLEAAINRYAFPTAGGKHILGKVQSTDLIVKSHPKLESGDPRICVIPGSPQLQRQLGDNWNWEGSVPSIWAPDEIDFGGIMINCVFLMQELKAVEDGDNKVHTFLTNVIKKISNTCGGYWNDLLEVVSTTEDCNNPKQVPTISVVDMRKYKVNDTWAVPSNPNNSVIRDLKLDMKLTGAMKSQALYSNGAKQQGKGSKCDTIAFTPFGMANAGAIGVKGKPKAATPPPCDCAETKQAGKSEKPSYDDVFDEMWDVVDNGTTGAAISAVTAAVNGSENIKETCAGQPLPFDFGFTVDGIGGFAFGQAITSDRIPPAVAKAFDFQITSVEHEISVNDWTTTVSTVARYKK